MYMIKDKSNDKLFNINTSNFYVVADFDFTISTHDSKTTLSLFSLSGLYGDEYPKERNANHDYYRPLELNPKISDEEKFQLSKEWQTKSIGLMLKYKVRESDISRIINTTNLLKLRDGAIDFIKKLNEKNIPLIIVSAGCGNFIEETLKVNECMSNNIYIHSNMLEFKDDVIIDSKKEVIHSMNKFNIDLPDYFKNKIDNKKYAIVIGDQLSDLNMAKYLPKKTSISFGFLEANIEENEKFFTKKFDVVLKDNESFNTISDILKL